MRRKDMLERMTQTARRTSEPILKQPLVELCGLNRVLIENHRGVREYSAENICVWVVFGLICINGQDLEICRMTADQLVITGNVDTVTLLKGTVK